MSFLFCMLWRALYYVFLSLLKCLRKLRKALHTYIHTYLLARPLGAFQSQMDKAQWIKTRPQHRELHALLFTMSVWVL